jgi:tRNA threonylcarbamoyladenosine biosynthesis protein TsaB
MPRILAIETATKACSVAVADESSILGEISLFVPQVHAERLVVMLNNLLENLRLSYRELDAVAFSSGPGSFTGLRIGLSVAKGIAFGQKKELIAVPTLEAIASGFQGQLRPGELVVPILHARANEFYYAAYLGKNSELEQETSSRVADADSIVAEFPPEAIFVGEGVVAFSKHGKVKSKFERLKNLPASARDVATIARDKFVRGEFADLRTSVPMYIKDFMAIKGNPLSKLSEKI